MNVRNTIDFTDVETEPLLMIDLSKLCRFAADGDRDTRQKPHPRQ
jgi:hypothetical protein